MIAKKVRIAIFSSSQSLKERIMALTSNQQFDASIYSQALDDAIPIAAELEHKGIEVVISRRGTAYLLRENLSIPVLSFPHRSLDILLSLKAAAEHGKRILITVFRQFISGISILGEILNIDVVQKIYHDRASMEAAVAAGKREGCDVAVGGGVTQYFAEVIGLKFIELKTSDEDVTATIEDARSVALAGREEKAMTSRYRSIIDAASEGIIAVDAGGCITTINAAAKKLLRSPEEEVVGKPIDGLIPDCPIRQVLTTRRPIQDRLSQIEKNRFIFSYLPVMVDGEVIGAVSTFSDIQNVMRTENVVRRSLSHGLVAKYTMDDLICNSPAMRGTIDLGKQFAKTDSTILLIGDTGTGKEIFAHAIHGLSSRSRHPFVSVNCAALPEQLLESELFGHEEGAFTGSKKGGKPGKFEIAHQGTLFLDEIDSTPKSMQIQLLRVLQEKEVMRIGGDRQIPVDVRIIAAASHDLSAAVREGNFRADLFFRINVLSLQIPPLRKRPEDVPVLLAYFIRLFSNQQKIESIDLPASYMERLIRYAWPGNVRQLRNFAEKLVMNCRLRCHDEVLESLYHELLQHDTLSEGILPKTEPTMALKARLRHKTSESEKEILSEALQQAKYHRRRAAETLGISRSTLWRKMKEMGLE